MSPNVIVSTDVLARHRSRAISNRRFSASATWAWGGAGPLALARAEVSATMPTRRVGPASHGRARWHGISDEA
jgi:hypothetical protein